MALGALAIATWSHHISAASTLAETLTGSVPLQNPRERITLSRVMRHPWVTKRSAWPLLTVREMGGCTEAADDDMNDINPQLVQLPDLMATSNVLDIPRQVPITVPLAGWM